MKGLELSQTFTGCTLGGIRTHKTLFLRQGRIPFRHKGIYFYSNMSMNLGHKKNPSLLEKGFI